MQNSKFQNWLDSSYLIANNQSYVDQMYKDFLHNPDLVDASWNKIFKQWDSDINFLKSYETSKTIDVNGIDYFSMKILQLINSFRTYGHQYSTLDPIGYYCNNVKNDFLQLEYYKFSNQDLNKKFNAVDFGIHQGIMTVDNMYRFLKNTYCGSIGIEYMHILDTYKVLWIQNQIESELIRYNDLHKTEQQQFLKEIIAAEELEHYLGIKFPGVKRFSLEGGDVLIPMLKEVIRYSVKNYNVQDIFIGMAHRGRLNTLINVLGKNLKELFDEFNDNNQILFGSGDVKYHQGLCSNITINNNTVSVSLLFNPSHLEIVTPIVMGVSRFKIDCLSLHQYNNKNVQNTKEKILSIIIHGDAAFSAQGVVQESFNMSNTDAYNVGGTIHIVINNQIGFTTSNIYNMRSTSYCTDIAKMVQAPILHVNSDDVNAVIFVTRFALNFRHQFKQDIIIDLVCYRRHGHNEVDDPSVTQPIMYQKIFKHPTIKSIYSNTLNKLGIINNNDTQKLTSLYRTQLEKEHCVLKEWQPIHTRSIYYQCNSKNIDNIRKNVINSQYLKDLAYRINDIPSHIVMHDRVKKIYSDRLAMALEKQLFDWGASEVLAYATILDQGYSIRLSGEDVTRGTFFHRHVVLHDQNNGKIYVPLMHIQEKQGMFYAWDSVLSEESALAFEYGYATMSCNKTLVIWEAQFGDFSNGAQVVIDQFISASEQKWNQICGLIMLLPHGYEGQGPEHSSSRIERYLQLCAEHNMWICVPSTPAQIYHLLRKQANNILQKPLIIISPKSLLRHTMVTSSINDLAYGVFNTVIDETNKKFIVDQIKTIILCTGKIYYDLINERNLQNLYNIAIIRIEQLYPFPEKDIIFIFKKYSYVKKFIWCQEEPKNQGAWCYIQRYFYDNISNIKLQYIGRSDSAAPAVGQLSIHKVQQKKIIMTALDLISNI